MDLVFFLEIFHLLGGVTLKDLGALIWSLNRFIVELKERRKKELC